MTWGRISMERALARRTRKSGLLYRLFPPAPRQDASRSLHWWDLPPLST